MNTVSSLWGYCSPLLTNFLNLKKNLDYLRSAIDQLESKRADVMNKIDPAESDLAESSNEVKNWLERVEATKKEVNEISEQSIITQILILRNSVIEKLTTMKELIREGEFRVVAERRLQRQIQEIPTAAGIVGMESKLEELLKSVNEDDQVRILGIWGMGGVGKTTLLQKLNNELSKRNLVIWVVVCKDMNLQNVQKQIAKSLNLTLSDDSDLVTTAREIFRVLTNKKFVLLLDDIWQRIDLQSIGVPSFDSNSSHEINKSMVVFTTRSNVVCRQMEAQRRMKLDCLNWSEAWSLFQEKVGKEVINGHPQIPALAEVVAKECLGLPLALIVIGRTMASKETVGEWKHAINVLSKSASGGMDEVVLRILKFSYDNLRNDKIKSCFLYCSLFPEDHHIDTEELIDYWIAEGYIDDFENIDEARDQGHDIIGCLGSASLLETYGNPTIKSVKMHDVVRDLAIWIVSDNGRNEGKYLAEVSSLKLGTQSIGRYFMFPENSGQLSKLRYLNTRLNLFPNELKSLANLMFLRMGKSSIKLPSGVMPCLAQLRVLDMHESDFKDWEMEGCASLTELESLKHLNELHIRIGNLVALQKLVSTSKFQLITRRLYIITCEGITSVSLSKSSPSLSFANLKNLRTLEIRSCEKLQELRISPWGMEALENLLLKNLPKLEIVWDNKQLVLPAADQLKEEQLVLSDLQSVEISECESIKDLEFLSVSQTDGIEEIISDGFLVDDDHTKLNLFSNLTTISLSNLRNLRSICSNSLALPLLKYVDIRRCPKLKKLPLHNDSKENHTFRIYGEKEWWDSLEWDDDTVKDHFSSLFMACI